MSRMPGAMERSGAASCRSLSFAFALTAGFLCIAGFSAFHHEMWRDEIQAWLLARDSSSLIALAENTKYEGHPFLWFLALWPIARVTHRPEAMQVVNLLISAGTVFIVARFGPGPRWIRALATFGYFPVYEYGTIARTYSLGLLLLSAFFAVFPRRKAHPLLAGLILALAANTSAHAMILATAALASFAIGEIAQLPESRPQALVWTGVAIAAIGIVIAAWQIWPPPDSGYGESWRTAFDPDRARHVMSTITSAYAPVRMPGPGFFPTRIPASAEAAFPLAWVLGVVLVGWIGLALSRHPVALTYFAAGTLCLLAVSYVKFIGYLRHHGFHFICFATSLWLAAELAPRSVPKRLERMSDSAWRSLRFAVPILLSLQVIAAGIAVGADRSMVFSGAKSAAELLRSRNLDRLPLVGDPDYAVSPILGFLDKERAYYPAGRRFGSFVIWDQARLRPYHLWEETNRLSAAERSPIAVALGSAAVEIGPPVPAWMAHRIQLIECVGAQLVPDEGYCIFVVLPP